jgi:hypothetical protein
MGVRRCLGIQKFSKVVAVFLDAKHSGTRSIFGTFREVPS